MCAGCPASSSVTLTFRPLTTPSTADDDEEEEEDDEDPPTNPEPFATFFGAGLISSHDGSPSCEVTWKTSPGRGGVAAMVTRVCLAR